MFRYTAISRPDNEIWSILNSIKLCETTWKKYRGKFRTVNRSENGKNRIKSLGDNWKIHHEQTGNKATLSMWYF